MVGFFLKIMLFRGIKTSVFEPRLGLLVVHEVSGVVSMNQSSMIAV